MSQQRHGRPWRLRHCFPTGWSTLMWADIMRYSVGTVFCADVGLVGLVVFAPMAMWQLSCESPCACLKKCVHNRELALICCLGAKLSAAPAKKRRFVIFIHRIPAVWSKQRQQTQANTRELKQRHPYSPVLLFDSGLNWLTLSRHVHARARTEATQQCSWQVVARQA